MGVVRNLGFLVVPAEVNRRQSARASCVDVDGYEDLQIVILFTLRVSVDEWAGFLHISN